ncbi:hypothetical protein Dimus_006142, partial [Dionaea muscipula]
MYKSREPETDISKHVAGHGSARSMRSGRSWARPWPCMWPAMGRPRIMQVAGHGPATDHACGRSWTSHGPCKGPVMDRPVPSRLVRVRRASRRGVFRLERTLIVRRALQTSNDMEFSK